MFTYYVCNSLSSTNVLFSTSVICEGLSLKIKPLSLN